MKKKSFIPQTRVKNPEPKKKGTDWVIWAAWADRNFRGNKRQNR